MTFDNVISSQKVLLTTSRRPTDLMRSFSKDLARSIPGVVRVNRGKLSLDGVAEKALECAAERVVVVDRWRGGSGEIELFKVSQDGLMPVPPVIFVSGMRLRREFWEAKSRRVGSLAVTAPSSSEKGVFEVAEALSNFFGIPFLSLDEAVSRCNTAMHFSVDSRGRVQFTFLLLPQKVEIGPRVTISNTAWETAK